MKAIVPQTNLNITETPTFIKSPIQLTISLLVSNRLETIRKCMESLKIILDAIPSELIAVDTVGEEQSDGSLAIVREYTDKIVHFDWTGDFSAARNAGLALAKGEWFLYVDDDEWFEDPTEIIDFFQTGECRNYGCTQYAIRSYTEATLTEYSEGWVSRMVRRTKETRFIHRVHEMLSPRCEPEKHFSKCFAHHVGYVFKNANEKRKHFERNIHPILEELQGEPDNLRLVMQAIQEYMFDKDYEKAEEYCRLGENNQDPGYLLVWNWIMTLLIHSLLLQKKFNEVLSEGQRVLQLPRLNELARMNIDYAMVSAAQSLDDSDRILKHAMDYAKLGEYFDQNPDKVLEQVVLSLRDILRQNKREIIHNCIFMTCKNLQRYADLCEYADMITWDQDYRRQKIYILFLLEAAANSENYGCLTRTITKICTKEKLSKELLEDFQKACNCADREKRYQLRKAFANVDCEEPYFFVLKAWCAEQDNGDVQGALQECFNRGLDATPPREELLGICLRAGIDPTPFLKPLYMEDWMVSFSQLVTNTLGEDLQNLLDAAKKTLYPISESQYFVLCKMIRQRLLHDPNFPEDQLWETVKAYADDILGYYQHIYQEKLFADSQYNLPREAVFGLQLEEALQAKQHGNLDKTFKALKECVRAYPSRKNFVNRLLDQIEKEINQQKEFTVLGEQIKKQIYYLISLGQTVQAQQVLEQLRTLTPNDLELDTILQKIQA